MEFGKPYNPAPDPLTEPEKCAGLRNSFAIISILGVAIFLVAILVMCLPDSFAQSLVQMISPGASDPLALAHGSGAPILGN